jgi:hypothetical protein
MKPKKKSTRGGARAKSGRKPVEDKKVAVTFYVRQSVVDRVGIEEAKTVAASAVETLASGGPITMFKGKN